ncbi:unnamed protein product [Eruca vesicaria subsp. sativa]|uniref:RING-type domain-containing protein n=1 Tax=Eruca vesicaria subsp. sativa TaxID=29727 RepID=A0ABC8L974_ERUVS|nr:unnamed protein product [Eruca vesicaria subsp. sativa]
MQPNQVEIDAALAASLLYYDPESTIYDEVTARQIQQREEEASLVSDEKLAREWQDMEGYPQISLSDDEKYAKRLQEEELNRSISLHCGSSSHQQSHVGGSIDTSSYSFQSPPPSGDIDPDNMTYEELNELGQSIGTVNKGLSKSRIDQIPTHKFGATSWFRKKVSSSVETECSICLIVFKKGDTISTLPCAHIYHKECISHWLEENKNCCVCKAEVGLMI